MQCLKPVPLIILIVLIARAYLSVKKIEIDEHVVFRLMENEK